MLTFQKLWDARPHAQGHDNPCTSNGTADFPDPCAIRLGVVLAACHVNTAALPGVRHCWQHDKSKGHTLSAEELARGLKTCPPAGLRPMAQLDPQEFASALRGRRGIVFFKDYWRRTKEDGRKESFAGRTGDHIDLWNGFHMAHPFSAVQVYLRIGSMGFGTDHRHAR
jgi:hypothetical protein